MKITLGFRFFSWILGAASQGAPPVSTTPATNFATSSAGVVDTGGKFFTSVNNTGGKLPPVSIMGTISDCWQLKVNLKEKMYLYANSSTTTQRCPKEIMKTFLIEDFFSLAVGGAPWAANISTNFQKILNGPNGIIRGLGETDPCRKPEVENLVALSF